MRLAATILGLALLCSHPAAAENIFLTGGGGRYNVKTTTLKDYRNRDVIMQQRDFSCGSAALATLLTYHYDRPVSETAVLNAMYEKGDQSKIEKEGFSLLDMKNYLSNAGLKAEGYQQPLSKLEEAGIPAIVLINEKGYLHFVLVRGLSEEKVLIADPARGMKTYNRDDFEEIWNGIMFVVLSDLETAQDNFNLASHWGRPLSNHHLREMPGMDLATYTLHTSRTPGYF